MNGQMSPRTKDMGIFLEKRRCEIGRLTQEPCSKQGSGKIVWASLERMANGGNSIGKLTVREIHNVAWLIDSYERD